MKTSSWRETTELVGIAAIVVSLVFVGVELRQSRQIAIAAQYQERMRTGFDYFFEMSENEIWQQRTAETLRARYDVTELSSQDREVLEDGTPKDIVDWFIHAEINLIIFDNYHLQYLSGLSTDEAWQAQRNRLKDMLRANSFARQQLKTSGSRHRSSFIDIAKQLVDEIEGQSE